MQIDDLLTLPSLCARRCALVLMAVAGCGMVPRIAAQSELLPIRSLRISASQIPSPRQESLPFDLRRGIGPDEAALIAAYLNPALRSARDRRGLALAQVVQAGVLPNPQVAFGRDFVTGGNTAGTTSAYNFNAGWEVTSLLPLLPRRAAARANLRSVDLDIAWVEWQTAEAARTAVYRVVALREQLASASESAAELARSAATLKRAVEAHEKTVLDSAAAESLSQDARAIALLLEQEYNKRQLELKRLLGVPPGTDVRLRTAIGLPSHLHVPTQAEMVEGLETRRLDLLGLQQGYRSEDAAVRAAILAQFPKISVGFVKASDNTNVRSEGIAITLSVPLFDRNQGVVAIERATRQKVLDEYHLRVFEAHSDIAIALSDLRSLNRQVAAAEEALPIFERLVNSAEAAMNQGNTDVLAYYSARSTLIQKRVQVVKLEEQLLEALTALENASGRFIPANVQMNLK